MPDPLRFQHFQVLTKPDGSPQVLGQGAMGTTYKAFDTNLHSIVVIKVINPQYVTNPIARQRFLQEAQAMAKIQHPNVATAFHLSETSQGLFFAMEFCDGPNLQEYVEANGPMSCGDALMICQHVSSALQAAQKVHLVHRDLKPSNLILVKDEQNNTTTKVIDFGLARTFGEEEDASTDLTAGGFVGTANYASPEQLLEQRDLDTRSDIYSLGVTLWFMLCAAPTFRGSHFETMAGHVNEEPPWHRLPQIPGSALAILKRMLKKSPDDRYQTPAELWDDIQECLVSEGLTYAGAGLSIRIRKPKAAEGSILGTNNFEIVSEVGSGHTGKVFLGKDTISAERVAIKFLHKELIGVPGVIRDIRHQLRFLASVEPHPNILRTLAFDYSEKDLEARIIMEWVEGTNLLSLLRTWRKMSFEDALPLVTQLALGVDFALTHDIRHLELALHQILIHTPTVSRDRAQESEFLHQSLERWPEFVVKLDPLHISWTPEEHASTISQEALESDAGQTLVTERGLLPEESGSLLYRFSYIVYRLLGGVVTDIGKLQRYTQLSALSEEGNEVLESFLLTDDPERHGHGCGHLVAQLCKTEAVQVPEPLAREAGGSVGFGAAAPAGSGNLLQQPSPQPGMASAETGGDDMTLVVPRDKSRTAGLRPSTAGLRPSTAGLRPATSGAMGSSAFRSRRGGSTFAPTAPTSGGLGDAAFEAQRREVELKLRRLELERIAAEEEADRLSREEALEMQRRIVEEQRQLLEQQKAELEQQLQAEKKAVEEERKILSSERKRLDRESAILRDEIKKQETSLQGEKLKQQYEFQKFLEERKQWEKEKNERHDRHLRELQEARERLYLEEDKVSRQIEADRQGLEAAAAELAEKQARLQEEIARQEAGHAADLDAERARIEEERRNLESRLQRQTLDLDEAQSQVEAARRELQERAEAMQREAADREREREEALLRQREELEAARARLQQQEQALREAREQQEHELQARFAAEQRRLDEEAARLARQVEEASGAAQATATAMRAAAEEERATLAGEAAQRERELQRLKTEREALEAERGALQEAHDREAGQRLAREKADNEALRAREREIEELKERLAREEEDRRGFERRREAELEALLAGERAALAEERTRIERAREAGGIAKEDVEKERAELEALRTQLEQRTRELEERGSREHAAREAALHSQQQQLAAQQEELSRRRTAFDQEQAELRARVDVERQRLAEIEAARQEEERKLQAEEKEYNEQVRRRAAEFAALESAEEKKLAELRQRVSAEEQRLAAEREKIAAIERENDFNLKVTQQTRDDFSEDAGEAIRRHEELRGLLAEIKRQQRRRVATIAIGFLLLTGAGTYAAINLYPRIEEIVAPGSRLAKSFDLDAAGLRTQSAWPELLRKVVAVDAEFSTNAEFAQMHSDKRDLLMTTADEAVEGMLASLRAGQPAPLDEVAGLLSSLDYASGWEPVGSKKLLAARLQLALAVSDRGATAPEAVGAYVSACTHDAGYIEDLAPDLGGLVHLLNEATAGAASVTRRDELIQSIGRIDESAHSSTPRLVLLSGKLLADSAREQQQFDRALQACIDTVGNRLAEGDWLEALRPYVARILDELAAVAGQTDLGSLVAILEAVGRTWQTPRPFSILAGNSPEGSQERFDYSQKAAGLGDLDAKVWVAMTNVINQPSLAGRRQGADVIVELAKEGFAPAVQALAEIHLELFTLVEWPLDHDAALEAARQAKGLGSPRAAAYEGKVLLEKAIANQSATGLAEARAVLEAAVAPDNPDSYFDLFRAYDGHPFLEGDLVKAHAALVKGADLKDVNCRFVLANWCAKGSPPPQELNLTAARDLHIGLVKDRALRQSREWLKAYEKGEKGPLGAVERKWIEDNRHVWQ